MRKQNIERMLGNPANGVLYCFKFEEETGKVIKTVIDEYYERHPWEFYPERVIYSYIDRSTRCDIYGKNLNQVKHMKIYTFDPSVERAVYIFREWLLNKLEAARKEANRCEEAYQKFSTENITGDT